MSQISILIVDHDPARAADLASTFHSHDDLSVVASVETRDAALRQIPTAAAVMLLHVDAVKRQSLQRFLDALRERAESTRTVMLYPAPPGDERIIEALRQGVRGYLVAPMTPPLVVKAVRAVAAGEIWAERRILEKAISAGRKREAERSGPQLPELEDLTDRERDMLDQVLKGASNREIAESSSISERTVKTHLYRVYRKLNVKSRAKAIALLSQ